MKTSVKEFQEKFLREIVWMPSPWKWWSPAWMGLWATRSSGRL